MELPKRKNPRLKDFDYSTSGAYFITICTKNMKHYLGAITVGRGLAPAASNDIMACMWFGIITYLSIFMH